MNRTADSVLRDLNARLDLPARRRALLLRELRADFEDLVATLVAEGLSPGAAHERALQLLAPDPDDAGLLSDLHRTRYARLVAGLRPTRLRALERVGIGAMAGLAVLAPVLAVARSPELPLAASVVLGFVAALLLANLGWQAFRIVVRNDADAESLARAGITQAGLVGLTLSSGGLVVLVEASRALAAWEVGGVGGVAAMAPALIRCAAAASLTLGVTILGVFGALALVQWHFSARTVEEELRALLSPDAQSEGE